MFQRSTAGLDVLSAGAEEEALPAPAAADDDEPADPPRGSSHSVPATSAPYSGGCIVIDRQKRRSRAAKTSS